MKKVQEFKFDKRTAKLLNRICNERFNRYTDYCNDPCLTNLLHYQQALKLEEDIFEIMGIDLPEFIYSDYRKY